MQMRCINALARTICCVRLLHNLHFAGRVRKPGGLLNGMLIALLRHLLDVNLLVDFVAPLPVLRHLHALAAVPQRRLRCMRHVGRPLLVILFCVPWIRIHEILYHSFNYASLQVRRLIMSLFHSRLHLCEFALVHLRVIVYGRGD